MDAEYRQAVNAQEALERRNYEVHSRLRFNHRGQVAMALGVSNDDNDNDATVLQPQFFITLDEAPYLDGKHVLFGTIVGPTMFNALRIGRTHVANEESPADLEHAPRVVSVKIVDNPVFTDLVAQTRVPWKIVVTKELKKKKKRKGKRDLNVLSFGNEMQDDEEMDTAGIKSSHDVVQSQALSNQVDDRVKEAVTSAAGEKIVERKTNDEEIEEHEATVVKSESIMIQRKEEYNKPTVTGIAVGENSGVAERAANKPATVDESRHAKPPKKSAVESRLAKYKKKSSTDKKQREEDTMAKLFAFQGKVRKQAISGGTSQNDSGPRDDGLAAKMARRLKDQQEPREGHAYDEAPTYHGQVLEHSDDEDERSKDAWLSTKFKCRKNMDMESSAGADGRTMDDYRVVDDKRNGHDDQGDDRHGHHRDRKRRKHHSKHHGDRRGSKHG